MNATISIEKYVLRELICTLEVGFLWAKGVERNPFLIKSQWNKLLKAIHLFMLDIEVVEFKDLKLPSEQKVKEKEDKKEGKPKWKGAKNKAKQLALFFVKYTKKTLFYSLLAIELVVENIKDKLVKNEPDFENRIRR